MFEFVSTTPDKARSRIAAGRISDFFKAVGGPRRDDVAVFVVTHLLPDRPFFVEAVADVFTLAAVFPKPKSQDVATVEKIQASGHLVEQHAREEFAGQDFLQRVVELAAGKQILLLDIGGYFVDTVRGLAHLVGDQLLGVVEDTENGQQRYEQLIMEDGVAPCPIFSVARSPLKRTEDYLVGQAVIHSAEHLIRLAGHVLGGKSALVFGFGKIGRSVATNLRVRGVDVAVIDTDPVRQVEALSLGFPTADRTVGLRNADLVVGATGNLSLRADDWANLKSGAFVFTVTSSDDELDLAPLHDTERFDRQELEMAYKVTQYSTDGTYFYLLNDGNAVNFLHNAVVGDFIFLVQAEIISAARSLRDVPDQPTDKILQISDDERKLIAGEWLRRIAQV